MIGALGPRIVRRAERAVNDAATLARWARRPLDVLFYSGAPVDEAWVRSTKRACERRGLTTAHATSSSRSEAAAIGAWPLSVEALRWMRARVLVTASSGLPAWGRPRGCDALVHMPHSLVSLHMVYPVDAFDAYDVLFSCGEHHDAEIREIARRRPLALRHVRRVGYGKGDLFPADDEPRVSPSGRHTVLLAPSWQAGNVLESLGVDLVARLVAEGHVVVVRPHSVTLRERPSYLREVVARFSHHDSVKLELEPAITSGLTAADAMISDYSGVAFEFAFARPRPVVFVDVPRKVRNPAYGDLLLAPIEVAARAEIGNVVPPTVEAVVRGVGASAGLAARERIVDARWRYATHWGHTAEHAADALVEMVG